MDEKVIEIAKRVREKCEKFAMSEDAREYDFYKCEDLACMCAVASHHLWRTLQKAGYDCNFIEGEWDYDVCHCWVEIDDHILDVTATQFYNITEKVYLTKIGDTEYYVKGNKYDEMVDWDLPSQTPPYEKVQKFLEIEL